MDSVPTLEEYLDYVCLASGDEIIYLLSNSIDVNKLLRTYLEELQQDDKITASRTCLLSWAVTGGTHVPRELQLHACLATYKGQDSLIGAGTRNGKTLPIVLNLLLDDPKDGRISLTISPLKCLQVTQENDFNTNYSTPTIAINDDTPQEDVYWNVSILSILRLMACHIIATVEQLFKTPEGHYPRLAALVWHKLFQRRIKQIHVNKAHFMHTTVYTLATVESKTLCPNYVSIRVSSNRPNTMYAMHHVVSRIEECQNYDCFLLNPFDPVSQPCILIFFDDTDLASSHRGKGIIRHYHSGMSEQYLCEVHQAFTEEDGICKILCTTSGESIGIDFPDVKIVCNVGLPSSIIDVLQRGGQVGHRDRSQGLFVLFYELWALTIPLNEYANSRSDDPDCPCVLSKPTASRKERAPLSCVKLVQCQTCLWEFFTSYLGDNAANGALLSSKCVHTDVCSEALHYNMIFCCD
ncbi:P-loop containing nucleoside triphosphate hydrolase protein [Tricholoma matsutake]|nr:P-loop containing nucleoside triphosphate hydrolase protein [Tricholoma matsutake 945]